MKLLCTLFFVSLVSGNCPVASISEMQSAPTKSQDSDTRISELRKKAEGSDVDAQMKLARAYALGEGVQQDPAAAANWYLRAAQQGNAKAQTILGLAYMSGEGIERDKSLAVAWYKKAARQNYADAMYHLGTSYYNGDGVEINDAKAYAWFLLAREFGSKMAIEAVQRAETELTQEKLTEGLKEIARNYQSDEILAKDDKLAARWWFQAAEKGDREAQLQAAVLALSGRGQPQDFALAKKWCDGAKKQSESEGSPDGRAYYCLGLIAETVPEPETDLKKAREWYEKAYKLKNTRAAKALARMYATGEGGKINRPEAWIIYFAFARGGDFSVKPQLIKLKTEMSKKEWDEVVKHLRTMRVAPETVDQLLAVDPSAK